MTLLPGPLDDPNWTGTPEVLHTPLLRPRPRVQRDRLHPELGARLLHVDRPVSAPDEEADLVSDSRRHRGSHQRRQRLFVVRGGDADPSDRLAENRGERGGDLITRQDVRPGDVKGAAREVGPGEGGGAVCPDFVGRHPREGVIVWQWESKDAGFWMPGRTHGPSQTSM